MRVARKNAVQEGVQQVSNMGATADAIAVLPTVQLVTETDLAAVFMNAATCPVCLLDFEVGDEVKTLPCHRSHCFHTPCVHTWLAEHNTRPICRAELPR